MAGAAGVAIGITNLMKMAAPYALSLASIDNAQKAGQTLLALNTFQYDLEELMIDIEYAKSYKATALEIVKNFGKKGKCKFLAQNLEGALKRLDVILDQLEASDGVMDELLKQQSKVVRLAKTLVRYITNAITGTVSAKLGTAYTFMDPRWYRNELSFAVNQINILVDQIILYSKEPVTLCPKPVVRESILKIRQIEPLPSLSEVVTEVQKEQAKTVKAKKIKTMDPKIKDNPYALLSIIDQEGGGRKLRRSKRSL